MLHLTCSNQMEALVDPLARAVQAARAADPLGVVTLIVPDQSVAQYLRFRLAERLGIAAHLRFTFLTRYLKDLVEAADPGIRVVDADRLQLLLFARLRDPALTRLDGLERVQRYLDRATTEAERETRALQLALQLGRLFEEYGYSRREMLRAWRHGPVLRHPGFARTERWQQILWRQLFDDDGALRVALPPPPLEAQVGQLGLFAAAPTTRSMLLADAVAAASRRGLALPEAVHVFGLSYVAPAFAEIFARLAATGPLHVYAINPCMEFWEDVEQADESLRRAAQGRLVHRGDKLDGFDLDASQIGGLPQDFADPFELDRPGDTPALRLWGRPGREYVRLLNQLTDCRFEAHFRDPTRGQPPTLLGLLQRDILLRAPERPVATTGEPDASIRLLACPGVRREVEIVADHIWALVRARDAAGQPLRFHQIAVMVADPRREDYLTHVDAVFRERHGLPFNVIDRPLSGQSRVIEAIERLLDLPASHFEYAELMRLLTHPAVGGADPDVDAVRWRRWGDALKIVFGADRADLEDTYIDRDVFNWDQALRRLMLGAFVTGEKAGEPRPVELSTGVWMPFETGPDALADVGRLVTLARCLIADARALRTAELSVADWAVMLARLITRYVSGTRVDDELAISRCLAALEQLGAADLEGGAVSFEVARELVRARMAGLEGGRGQHQADGVVVSSLLPMRAVPFEAVFVLGLGEGRFPAPARNHPLDLRQARRLPGDVTPAERDRYLFLETLLAARQQVFLSWVARDATSGDAVEPSAVVKELQYLLRGYVPPDRLDALVEAHPVSAFDLTYFPDLKDESSQEPARSVSSEARRGARARALRLDVHRHLVAPPPEGEALITGLSSPSLDALGPMLRLPTPPLHAPAAPERVILPLYAIQRFLESPLQGAARFVLGLREDGTATLDGDADEPLVVDRQARFTLLRDAFFAGEGDLGAMEAAWKDGFERLQLKGEAPVGLFAEIRRHEDLATLATWAAHLDRLALPDLRAWQVYRIGRARADGGPVDALLDPLTLTIPGPDGRPLPVELHGRLLPLAPDRGAALRCLPASAASEKHFLPGFLNLVALSAAGVELPEVLRVLVLPTGDAGPAALERRYAVPPRAVCQQWFADVVGDLLTEVHDYRLPIETVLEWHEELRWRPYARPFIRRNSRDHPNSSQIGPVRTPEAFDLPPVEQARAMMNRRLGLWFQAQERARG